MTEDRTVSLCEKVNEMPKVELHRHLEGSLRESSMLEIAAHEHIDLPPHNNFSRLVQVQKDEPQNFRNFLSKFDILRKFYTSQAAIERYTWEAVEDAAADGVVYLELTFTPVALSRIRGYPLGKVMDWVTETAQQAAQAAGIQVRLIASANRHESPELAAQVAELAVERKSRGIVGLGLVGNEAEFPAKPFLEIFDYARRRGLSLVIHAGEWGGVENVRQAIEDFSADRIGHGVRVLEDPAVIALAQQKQTPFEVCLTSNCQSGVFSSLTEHPLKQMLEAGLNITLNTDDPGISDITLSHEYMLALDHFGVSWGVLSERVLAAARAAFLPESEKSALVKQVRSRLVALNDCFKEQPL